MAKAEEKNEKRLTMRQEMREAANSRLEEIVNLAGKAMEKLAMSTPLHPIDIARMLCGGQTKTLRDKLVTQLTNKAEEDLVALWNDQKKLDLGEEK